MSLLNYTTSVAAEKTLGEIQALLARAGAQAILVEYKAGIAAAVSFRIETEFGVMTFRLPANIDRIFATLQRQKVANRYKSHEQAARVAWRIIKDWLAAQLAIIQSGMVAKHQVFLPYAQGSDGKTLFETLADKRFEALALPSPK